MSAISAFCSRWMRSRPLRGDRLERRVERRRDEEEADAKTAARRGEAVVARAPHIRTAAAAASPRNAGSKLKLVALTP